MGIDYRAVIAVGLQRSDIQDLELFESWIDNDELTVCPPYYDGGGDDDAVVGYEVYRSEIYRAREFEFDLKKIEDAKEEFKKLTGLDAKVWISPYGY